MQTDEKINPDVLAWARRTAGLSIEEAADKLNLTSGPRGNAEEKLAAIEDGTRAPTEAQLAKMAQVYRRPLIVLYMAAPPREADAGEDFRTVGGYVSPVEAARLDALVRDVKVRHSILRELVEVDGEARPLPFVGSIPIKTPVVQAVSKIKTTLAIPPGVGSWRAQAGADLFKDFRRRVEDVGIFVLLLGDLGSWQTAIPASLFRGFAVADELAPMIVINDNDAKAAWSFTLAHELAHIFVGSTGISGAPTTHEPKTPKARVEQFCNDVAGEMLLPTEALKAFERLSSPDALQRAAEVLAHEWGVSEPMAAYRLWRVGRTDADAYRIVASIFAERWRKSRQQSRETRADDDSGPNFYIVRRHRLGEAVLRTVGAGLRADLITHSRAGQVLGVRPGAVEAVLANPSPPQRRAG